MIASLTISVPQADLTPWTFRQRWEAGFRAEDRSAVEAFFGQFEVTQVRVRDLDAAFAVRAPGAKGVRIEANGQEFSLELTRLGDSELWVGATNLNPGLGCLWQARVDGKLVGEPKPLEAYLKDIDTQPQPGVPKGRVIAMPNWTSRVFSGITREWWVYVPAQYDGTKPACTMVVQDGQWAKGYWPTALDNLIHRGEMPLTIAVFLRPGKREDGSETRSFEYDVLSDRYSRMLLEEIIPEVEKTYRLRKDPESRGIAGSSSGAICAFTVAWNRPDAFHKVLSWIGSYVDLAKLHGETMGGDDYPSLIRKTDRKPIRVWLQDGRNDLDNPFGNWWLANLQMERALRYKGYDMVWQPGNGFHSNQHGEATLPTALRWLWRDVRDTAVK